jgi:hypothetical protein
VDGNRWVLEQQPDGRWLVVNHPATKEFSFIPVINIHNTPEEAILAVEKWLKEREGASCGR